MSRRQFLGWTLAGGAAAATAGVAVTVITRVRPCLPLVVAVPVMDVTFPWLTPAREASETVMASRPCSFFKKYGKTFTR